MLTTKPVLKGAPHDFVNLPKADQSALVRNEVEDLKNQLAQLEAHMKTRAHGSEISLKAQDGALGAIEGGVGSWVKGGERTFDLIGTRIKKDGPKQGGIGAKIDLVKTSFDHTSEIPRTEKRKADAVHIGIGGEFTEGVNVMSSGGGIGINVTEKKKETRTNKSLPLFTVKTREARLVEQANRAIGQVESELKLGHDKKAARLAHRADNKVETLTRLSNRLDDRWGE